MIVNVTRGIIIYNPSNAATNGTLTGSVLTLTFNTTAHSNTDILQIFTDDGDTGSTEQSLSQLLQVMTEFTERLDVYSDGAGRLQVAITNASSQGSLASVTSIGTVTTVSTVSTVTSLTSAANLIAVGSAATNLDNIWRLLHEVPAQSQNSLFPVT